MFLTLSDGRLTIILVCGACRHSVLIEWPRLSRCCERCGERVEVPDDDETQPE